MAREKHYFRSPEIAHIWANQGSTSGRCASAMTFSGDAFYSYGTVIANRIRYKGKVASIIDGATFSSTTSGHQSRVRGAIRNGDKIFYVYQGSRGQRLEFTPQTLRDYYLNEFKTAKIESRYAFKRASLFLHKVTYLESAIEVCKYFGLAVAKLEKQLADLQPDIVNFRRVSNENEARRKELRDEREKQYKIKRVAQSIDDAHSFLAGTIENLPYYCENYLTEQPELLAQVQAKKFEKDKIKIESWRNGSSNEYDHNWPVYLRRENEEMTTTKGARVPITDAKRSFKFVMALKSKGWHRNGSQHAIGVYQLDAVNEQGVIAGCHRVTWEEIERFAKTQNWI